MRRAVTIYALTLATALAALTVWGCCGFVRHAIVAVDKLGDAGAGFAQTAARLNDPQKGTIKMLDEDVGATKSLIVHADLITRHEQQSLDTWDRDGAALFANANGAITDLRGSAKAATGTLNAATGTLNASQQIIAAMAPIETNANGAITDLRALTPELQRTATASANMMEHTDNTMMHVEGITGDGQKVADHYEQIIDNPKKSPWYIQMLPSTIRVAVEAALDKWAMSK